MYAYIKRHSLRVIETQFIPKNYRRYTRATNGFYNTKIYLYAEKLNKKKKEKSCSPYVKMKRYFIQFLKKKCSYSMRKINLFLFWIIPVYAGYQWQKNNRKSKNHKFNQIHNMFGFWISDNTIPDCVTQRTIRRTYCRFYQTNSAYYWNYTPVKYMVILQHQKYGFNTNRVCFIFWRRSDNVIPTWQVR